MATVVELERHYWANLLGLTDELASKYSLADLQTMGYPVGANAYSSIKSGRPSNSWVFLGDSILLGSDAGYGDAISPASSATPQRGDSIPFYAQAASGGKIRYIANCGVAGQTAAQILARVATDVVVRKPQVCCINVGTNDTGQALTIAQYITNVTAAVNQLRAAGIFPVLSTVLPASTAGVSTLADRKTRITQYNTWLKIYAAAQGIPLLDFYAQVVDPATGGIAAAYNSGDGIHLNAAGWVLLGNYINAQMGSSLSPCPLPLATDNNDPNNLLLNGLFLTGGSPIATSWSVYQNPPGGAWTQDVFNDPQVPGNMQRINTTATTGGVCGVKQKPGNGAGINPGDLLSVAAVMTVTGSIGGYLWLTTNSVSGITNFQVAHFGGTNPTRQFVGGVIKVPADASAAGIVLAPVADIGTGTVSIGQATVYNLTALGLASEYSWT